MIRIVHRVIGVFNVHYPVFREESILPISLISREFSASSSRSLISSLKVRIVKDLHTGKSEFRRGQNRAVFYAIIITC